MTIQQDYQLKPRLVREFSATGVVGAATIATNLMGSIKVAVEGVGTGNVVEVQGRLLDQSAWDVLATITGTSTGVIVDISSVDEIRFNCATYSASGTPKLIANSSPALGVGIKRTVSITRPADTTAYAAGDWVSNATSSGVGFVFTNIVPPGKCLYIDSLSLIIDATSVPSGMGGFTAWIFDQSTTFNDNAARDISYAAIRDGGIASIVISTPVDAGSSLRVSSEVKLARTPANGDLYIGLETLGAWTPASGTAISLMIHGAIL